MIFLEYLDHKTTMWFLGVDTFSSQGRLFIYDENGQTAQRAWGSQQTHSETLTTFFQELITEKNYALSQLKGIYCVTGPGSFTGLRVGVNFAKTLAYSMNCPLFPINSLWALAYSVETEGTILSLIDAQKNSLFCSLFEKRKIQLKPIFENKVFGIDNIPSMKPKPSAVTGPGWNRYSDEIQKQWDHKCNIIESNIGFEKIITANIEKAFLSNESWRELTPSYIKASAAEENLKPSY